MPDENTTQPFSLSKKPGDIIRASDWNRLVEKLEEMSRQMDHISLAIKQLDSDLCSHNHTPSSKGGLIANNAIAMASITGDRIDPKSAIEVNALCIDGMNIEGRKLKHFTESSCILSFKYKVSFEGSLVLSTTERPQSFYAEIVLNILTPTDNPGNGAFATIGLIFQRAYEEGGHAETCTYKWGVLGGAEIRWLPEGNLEPNIAFQDNRLQLTVNFKILFWKPENKEIRNAFIYAYAKCLSITGHGGTFDHLNCSTLNNEQYLLRDSAPFNGTSSLSAKFELAA